MAYRDTITRPFEYVSRRSWVQRVWIAGAVSLCVWLAMIGVHDHALPLSIVSLAIVAAIAWRLLPTHRFRYLETAGHVSVRYGDGSTIEFDKDDVRRVRRTADNMRGGIYQVPENVRVEVELEDDEVVTLHESEVGVGFEEIARRLEALT